MDVSGPGPGSQAGRRASEPEADTAVLPVVPAGYPAAAPARPKSTMAGAAGVAFLVVVAVTLGVTRPWHHSPDAGASTVPGVPTSSASVAAVPITPSTSAPATSAPATTAATTTSSSPSPKPTVTTPLTIVSSTLCLDASTAPGSVRSGAKVSAWTCQGGSNQKWQLHADGTIHSMADVNLCLDAAAPSGKVLDAAQVSAWSCNGGANQKWVWNSNGSVSPVANTRLCLDAAGPIHSGSNVTAWPCNGGGNEKWAPQQ